MSKLPTKNKDNKSIQEYMSAEIWVVYGSGNGKDKSATHYRRHNDRFALENECLVLSVILTS